MPCVLFNVDMCLSLLEACRSLILISVTIGATACARSRRRPEVEDTCPIYKIRASSGLRPGDAGEEYTAMHRGGDLAVAS